MEDLAKAMSEMLKSQQKQSEMLLEFEKQREEKQAELQRLSEEKQTKMWLEFEKQRKRERKEREEEKEKERREREEERREREEERKEFSEKILELQTQAEKKMELLTQVLSNRDGKESTQNSFSQSAICSAIETFYYDPNNDQTFANYFRRFGDIFRIDCKAWSDEMKVRLLLQKLGAAEHNKFVDYIIPKKNSELTFDETVKSLMELYCPKVSLFCKRWKCINLTRKEDQDYTTFASIVNRHCDDFELSSLTADSFKVLVFIQGLVSSKDAELRRRALNRLEMEPNITLQQLAEECQRIISEKRDSRNIEEAGVAHIRKIRSHKKSNSFNNQAKVKQNSPEKTKKLDEPRLPCQRCGELHWERNCPFKTRYCEKCRRKGHKSSVCSKKGPRRSYVKSTRTLDEEENVRKYVKVKIADKDVRLQLDSGSDLSIINYHTWCRIGRPKMLKTKKMARSVTRHKINFEGEVTANVTLKGKTKKLKMYILKNTNNLFGTDWITSFELWDSPISDFCQKVENLSAESVKLKEDLKEAFPEVFSDTLGRCTKMEAKFKLKENVTPVFKRKRSVPFASIEKIDRELDRLVKTGILTPVNYSEWAAPTVYVKKKSKEIRVCADFSTGLNEALQDHHYPLPSPEEVFTKLNGGKIFSKLDLSQAYLQLPVQEESSQLLCIATHKGLFKFNRLAFGIKVAPAIFQQVIDTMLSGLDFAIGYLDDILMKSESIEEHRKHVFQVFERIKEYGFTLKDTKCEFFLKKIKYLGQIIDKDGRRPDPERSLAIKDMPEPHNVTTLQSFLGLANYYQSFIPNMHSLRAPLNELLKKEKDWNWTEDCKTAFEKLKQVLTSELFLTHYDPKLEIIVASDASSYGIGCCILHKMPDGSTKPIAHASRTLLPAEKNYSQIEKESLSIIFAVTRFHRYLHGRHFKLQTDHKPLISIFGSKKGLPTHTANRLQRWGTILLNYDFDMEFLPSKQLGHADGLSRLIPRNREPLEDTVIASLRLEKDYSAILCNTVKELPVTLDDIKIEAEGDIFIRDTKEKLQTDEQTAEVFSTCDQVLLYRERVVVPATLQAKILKDFHIGHPGATRMKTLMRSYVYWKGMDKDIEEKVKRCKGCALAAKAPPIQFSPWPKADYPWSRIHVDYAGPLDGVYYLIIVDSFTKWPEVFKCKNPTTEFTIKILHELFARFGVVDCLVSDNGTQFTSGDFKEFMDTFQVNNITTPTYHPRSNGQAERFVDTLKRALKKAKDTPSDKALQQFLQVYRITPNDNTPSQMSPAEAMFARKIRPVFEKLLPRQVKQTNLTVPKKNYEPGERIFFQVHRNNSTFWEQGTVKSRLGRMVYMIEGPNGTLKKHLNQIRKRFTDEQSETPPEEQETLELIYDTFDLEQPTQDTEVRRSNRKRRLSDPLDVNPRKRSYISEK